MVGFSSREQHPHFGYHKAELAPRFYDYFWTWCCDNCGRHAGMTTQILQCPECYHHRCLDCPLDLQKTRIIHIPTSNARSSTNKHKSASNPLATNGDATYSDSRQSSRDKEYVTPSRYDDVSKDPDWEHLSTSSSTIPQPENPANGHPCNLESIGSTWPFVSPADIFHQNPEVLGSEINPGTPFSGSTHSQGSTRKSPDPSEIFSRAEVCSDSETEPGSDSDDSEEDSSDDDESGDDSNNASTILESRLFSILCHDLALAARVIPQIHDNVLAQLRFSYAMGATAGDADAPADGTSGATPAQGALSTASSTPASTGTNNYPQRQKRGRESERNDDEQEDGSPKRPRAKPPEDLVRQSEFACHFHKKDPQRYNPHVNRKYLHCICPAPSELRHIKDHFKAAHRPSQCDKCYAVFKNIDELVNHRSSESCQQGLSTLREGIDDSQWDKIGRLLKTKRGISPSGRAKHDIDKWFGIWDILFPGVARPFHPWNENVYARSAALPRDAGGILSSFEACIEHDIQEGRLQRNDETHRQIRHYLHALRMALDSHIENSGSSQFNINHSLNYPQVQSANERAAGMDLATGSNWCSPNSLSDDFGPAIEGYQEVSFPMGNTCPSLSRPSAGETASSQVVHSAPSHTSASPARGIIFDTDMNFEGHSSSQPRLPLPPSLYEADNTLNSDEHPYGQLGINLEEDQLSQDSMEALLHFNPTLGSDTVDFSSFNVTIDDHIPRSLGEFETDGYELDLDVDVNNNSLAVPLDLENDMPEALAPWGSKNDGNKFLWLPWKAQ